MLIIEELGESVSAHREGKFADEYSFSISQQEFPESTDQWFVSSYNRYIKHTFEEEVADVVIRVLDFATHAGRQISVYSDHRPDVNENIPKALFEIVRTVVSLSNQTKEESWVILQCFCLAEKMNFDLLKHIEFKMKYNETRPYKHGKAY